MTNQHKYFGESSLECIKCMHTRFVQHKGCIIFFAKILHHRYGNCIKIFFETTIEYTCLLHINLRPHSLLCLFNFSCMSCFLARPDIPYDA